ncbi:hypothetical protein D3C81_1104190 [compost metagenome]
MPVATVIAIGAAAGLAPGTASGLAVGAIKPDITRRTGPASRIDRELLGLYLIQLQVQASTRTGRTLVGARGTRRTDLTAFAQLRTVRLDAQWMVGGGNGDTRLTPQLQMIDFQFGERGGQQQRRRIGHTQMLQVHAGRLVGQAQHGVGGHFEGFGLGQGSGQHGQQHQITHYAAPPAHGEWT